LLATQLQIKTKVENRKGHISSCKCAKVEYGLLRYHKWGRYTGKAVRTVKITVSFLQCTDVIFITVNFRGKVATGLPAKTKRKNIKYCNVRFYNVRWSGRLL
jgi:hypothetical protein